MQLNTVKCMMQIEFMMETRGVTTENIFPLPSIGVPVLQLWLARWASVFVGGVNLVETLGHLLLINCYQL